MTPLHLCQKCDDSWRGMPTCVNDRGVLLIIIQCSDVNRMYAIYKDFTVRSAVFVSWF